MSNVLIFVVGACIGFGAGFLYALFNLDDVEDAEFEELEGYDYGDKSKDW